MGLLPQGTAIKATTNRTFKVNIEGGLEPFCQILISTKLGFKKLYRLFHCIW